MLPWLSLNVFLCSSYCDKTEACKSLKFFLNMKPIHFLLGIQKYFIQNLKWRRKHIGLVGQQLTANASLRPVALITLLLLLCFMWAVHLECSEIEKSTESFVVLKSSRCRWQITVKVISACSNVSMLHLATSWLNPWWENSCVWQETDTNRSR